MPLKKRFSRKLNYCEYIQNLLNSTDSYQNFVGSLKRKEKCSSPKPMILNIKSLSLLLSKLLAGYVIGL